VLPGITRQFALDTADDELLDIALRPLTMRDVLTADEVILCNSSWGFLPVIALEDTPLGPTPHKPGKVFRLLRTAWLARQHASA
jgi:branched-subunit amino acid aminotransferase/4-amino-4-deoxychorismate lyase